MDGRMDYVSWNVESLIQLCSNFKLQSIDDTTHAQLFLNPLQTPTSIKIKACRRALLPDDVDNDDPTHSTSQHVRNTMIIISKHWQLCRYHLIPVYTLYIHNGRMDLSAHVPDAKRISWSILVEYRQPSHWLSKVDWNWRWASSVSRNASRDGSSLY